MLDNYFKFKNDEWDYLIVLDACRFDYFSHFYKHFFDGALSKVFSLGSHTSEWCINTFREYYEDVIYVSANAHINSVCEVAGFNAKRHFHKVIDVWRFGWNKRLGTVHPGAVTSATLSLKDKYRKKRFIIHYVQPHAPHIFQENTYPNMLARFAKTRFRNFFTGKEFLKARAQELLGGFHIYSMKN